MLLFEENLSFKLLLRHLINNQQLIAAYLLDVLDNRMYVFYYPVHIMTQIQIGRKEGRKHSYMYGTEARRINKSVKLTVPL